MKKIKITPTEIIEEDLTAEEISQAETNQANFELKLQQEEQEKLNKETANQSAIDKLKALGLTEEEIEAFKGK